MLPQKVPNIYHCEKCDFHSNKLSLWKRHLSTDKHRILTDTSPKSSKSRIFYCDCGRSYLHRQSLYNHRKKCEGPKILPNDNKMITNVSKMVINDNKMIINDNGDSRYKCLCGKSYKFNSGYSRHKNVCTFVEEKKEEPQTTYEPVMVDLLKTLMCENKKLHEQLSVNALVPKTSNTMIHQTNNTNSHNKIINVQLFLSEKCADAMSIQHFAKQLEITLDDVCKNKKDCITNVVLKNLKPLSLTERPFHCTNPNNKEWYIKDENDGWEEDTGEKLIKNTEDGIMKKWMSEFESHYPKWMENDQLQEKYVKIAGSTTSELPEKTKLKLLRELAGEVPLTKDDMV